MTILKTEDITRHHAPDTGQHRSHRSVYRVCPRLKTRMFRKKVMRFVVTGMMIVILISIMYLAIVSVLLFYMGNEWCDLLYKNMTV